MSTKNQTMLSFNPLEVEVKCLWTLLWGVTVLRHKYDWDFKIHDICSSSGKTAAE